MAVRQDEIRKAAERVAASHGLEVVEIEFTGTARDRTLRVTLEKNAAGRAELKARVEARIAALGNEAPCEDGPKELPERLLQGSLAVEQLSGVTHEDCAEFSRDFGVLLDVEDLGRAPLLPHLPAVPSGSASCSMRLLLKSRNWE